MGGSLSTQERLFASQQWESLLELAMQADMDDAAHDTTRDGFCMSFKEWQALLGLLESGQGPRVGNAEGRSPAAVTALPPEQLRRGGGAASALSDQLTRSQLHCPLVPLTAHAFALWCGAIDLAKFRDRITRLEELVRSRAEGLEESAGEPPDCAGARDAAERRSSNSSGASSGAGERDGSTREEPVDFSAEDEGEGGEEGRHKPEAAAAPSAAAPPPPSNISRGRRLAQALRQRVRGRDRRSHGAPAQGTATLHLLDMYRAVEPLFRNLAEEMMRQHPTTTTTTAAASDESFDKSDSVKMRATFRKARETVADARLVGQVALCIGLALYAALVPHPTYAVEGVIMLRRLDRVMRGCDGDGGEDGSKSTAGGRAARDARQDAGPVTQQWPWVASLEAALVHQQHVLDVEQCLGNDGQQLTRSLRALRARRTAAQCLGEARSTSVGRGGGGASSGGVGEPTACIAPASSWAQCMAQYIGQRHVWGPLQAHFLSANVFDKDKPTVLCFFGPSGYGKSELAKQVASAVHGCPVRDLEASGKMIYLHMPSFSTKESIYSLVDPPAAHVGDGILLSALHAHPDAVVVLDEFEKSTAEAVQHIWLSAFQKDGVLRSLKRADRSLSTVRVTFILTCNTCDSVIEAESSRYLAASDGQRAKMREAYERQCRDIFRASLGDPFVNRVDGFFAFTPYSGEERQDYVELMLERLLASQQAKGRHVHVTPRCVAALAAELRTFHASTLEEALRPLLVHMAQEGWPSAVLTVESRAVERPTGPSGAVRNTAYVLLPTRAPADGSAGGTETIDVWEQLPKGKACLAMWEHADEAGTGTGTAPPTEASGPSQGSRPEERHTWDASCGGATESTAGAGAVAEGRALLLERDMEKATERELALVRELDLARELLVQKDLEIATLKERVLMLETLVAVMMCLVACCSVAVALLVGLKLTVVLLACSTAFMVLVLELPLRLLFDALGAFLRFLGPRKSAALLLLMSLWIMKASKGLRCS